MGKEESEEKQAQEQPQPRKIIKKFPFKDIKSKPDQDDNDLKDWKPQKIAQIKQQQKKAIEKQKSNIAVNFFSQLPKPTSKIQAKPSFLSEKMMMKPAIKPIKQEAPTAEQIKWDIEDKSFIKNEFVSEPRMEHELAEEDQGEITVDRIKWLNEDPQKTKEIDLTKVIDKNWKASVDKASFQTDIWSTSFLKGKGQLSDFVREAINTFDEDEVTINRRAMIKQKIKSRYGW